MSTQFDRTIDPKHYLRIIWRRRGIIIVCALAVISTTLVTLALVPKRYESSATLIIEDRPVLARELEQVLGGWQRSALPARYRDADRTAKIRSRIHSRPFLERVVKILRMHEDPDILDAAQEMQEAHSSLTVEEVALRMLVSSLKSRIDVLAKGSGIFKVTVQDLSPANAQLLAKWATELYVDSTIKQDLEHIRTLREFGADQLRIYEQKLKDSEEALERMRSTMIEEDLTSSVVRIDNFSAAQITYERLADEATTAQARVAPLLRAATEAGFGPADERSTENSEVKLLSTRLLSSQKRAINNHLASASASAASGFPDAGSAVGTSSSTDGLRSELYQAIENTVRSNHPETSPEERRKLVSFVYAKTDYRVKSELTSYLRSSLNEFRRRSRAEPADELGLARLEDEVRKNRQLLESFRAQVVATDISQAVNTTDLGLRIEIINPPQLPLSPSWPKTNKILVFAVFLGPLIGIGLAFFNEMTDPTLRSMEDIQRIATEPVLGAIPLIDGKVPRPRRLTQYLIPATVIGLILLTAGFFVARHTFLSDFAVESSVQTVNPEKVEQP